jgi:hypothetical protein
MPLFGCCVKTQRGEQKHSSSKRGYHHYLRVRSQDVHSIDAISEEPILGATLTQSINSHPLSTHHFKVPNEVGHLNSPQKLPAFLKRLELEFQILPFAL